MAVITTMIQLLHDRLQQAHSSELYRLYRVIGQVPDDAQRTLQVRQSLCMTVGYVANAPFARRVARLEHFRHSLPINTVAFLFLTPRHE